MIKQKLAILLDSNIIDTDTYQYVLDVINYLLENQVIAEVDDADVFLTHLAMAHYRQKTGEIVNRLDEDFMIQIIEDENYQKALEVWADIKDMTKITFAESELGFFYMHLLTLLKEW